MSTVSRIAGQITGIEKRVLTPLPAAHPEVEDRRDHLRRRAGFWVSLTALDGTEVFRSRADNVGEGGLHVTVPVGYGFAVGQRYEVLVGNGQTADEQPNLVGEGHYATVVRTRLLRVAGSDRIGLGLRFDQPVVL